MNGSCPVGRSTWLVVLLVTWTASVALSGPAVRPPATSGGGGTINRLIEQLGDRDYYTREQAQEELSRLGFEAFDALNEATTHDDLEIAARARYLLRLLQVDWVREEDPPQVKTLLDNYGWLKPEDRRQRIEKLARLPDALGIEAMCRIVRFEQSSELSKRAALELLAVYAGQGSPDPEVIRTIQESLEGSRRAGEQWLLAWANHHQDLESLVSHFARFSDAEQAIVDRQGPTPDTGALAALLRFQVEWLDQLERREQAVGAMRRLIALEKGDVADLERLLQWLIAQKAWPLVGELVERFEGQVQNTPTLLYLLAEAQADQGDTKLAEQTAERALKLRPGNSSNWLNERRVLAMELWHRNRPEWAIREFRYVLDNGPDTELVTLLTRHIFARLLHDRGEALEAAQVLEKLVDQFERHPTLADRLGVNPAAIGARMHYFYSCHYHEVKDHAKEREHIDQALAADPDELDALIARYHLPNQNEEYHDETRKMIQASAEALRQNIADQPDDPVWYNQFAWLIGNTEGDLDEALKYSWKSLELSPNEGAYYDTLAHVYYAKKDYANALKYQTKAAELESSSKLISDKLEVFRAAMESP